MTAHTYHPDSHVFGLQPECPRCEQLAEYTSGLDPQNRARLLAGEIHTELDERAATRLRELERKQRQQDPTHQSRR